MRTFFATTGVLLLICGSALAQDAATQADDTDDEASIVDEPKATVAATGSSPDQPKTMSGMSILGNEEAPKSLVIVPWKSSELGNDISLNDSLDERARPVDRDVFERELRYYAIRSGSQN
jgi:hypothetical protein